MKIILGQKKNISVVIFAVFWLLLAVKSLPMVFMTNDDAAIQVALSEMQTGSSYPYHQFINSLLGFLISGLYSIDLGIPWWYAWSILCVMIGVVCIQWTILENASSKMESIFFIVILGLAFWIYILGNISFTVVPCIFSMGIVFLLFSKDRVKWNYPLIILSIIALTISYWHRQSTGLVMFCYYAMALLYYVSSCETLDIKSRILRYIGVIGSVVILLFASTEVDLMLKEQQNTDDFRAYNNARILYMDYPHVSYGENPKVYENCGWDENLTRLVNSWCFLDERVTAEAFSTIASAETVKELMNENKEVEEDTFFMPLLNLLEMSKYADMWTWMTVIAFFGGEIYICVCGFGKTKINFFYVLNTIGSLMLICYLISKKRLPLRAYMIIIIPLFLILCLLMMKVHKVVEKKHNLIWYVYMGILLAFAVSSFLYNYDAESIEYKINNIEDCNAIDSYLQQNGQNIYISDFSVYNSIYPFSKIPSNLIHWGGSTYHSKYFYLHLEENGLSELNMETFKQDNVYMLTRSTGTGEYSNIINMVLECLRDYGMTGVERIDVINGTCDVYKFYFEETIEN